MKNKYQFITKDVAQHIDLVKFNLHTAQTIPEKAISWFKKHPQKTKPIYLYDLGFNTHETIIPINNHINKTGTNPLRNQKNNKIEFYDITNIYQLQKNGKTAECFGQHSPNKKNTQYIQTRFLCNYAIVAHYLGFKKIFAYIIN